MSMDEMIRMLAQAPAEQRMQMMKQRLEMFAAMPEDKRAEGIAEMLRALHKLPAAQVREFIKGRSLLVASLPEEQRKKVMIGRMAAGKIIGAELDKRDMQYIEEVLPELPADLRNNFVRTKDELMKAMAPPAVTAAPAPAPKPAMGAELEQMIAMLADAPEDQRKQMIKQRLEMILGMPHNRQKDAIVGMLLAIGKLSAEKKRRFIQSRTAVVASFPEEQRRRIVHLRVQAGMDIPKDVHESDKDLTLQALMTFPKEAQTWFMNTMQDAMKAAGMPMPPMAAPRAGGPPVHHDRPMQKKGFFTKRWECGVCGHRVPA